MLPKVYKIGISKTRGQKMINQGQINVIAGKGIKNDRFYKINNKKISQITIIEKEKIDDFNALVDRSIDYLDFRRNIISEGIELNNLVNKTFLIGSVKILAHKLCEPCFYLQKSLNQNNLFEKLSNKAGLRCEIITDGKISIGDFIKIY
jgi:MOSC domain-containing protein YiiM|tara:strand:+ start:488 stop:934 length:447 start_codon:yes stop_codon:yes gene_type:complete